MAGRKDVLLIVDMQVALIGDGERHDSHRLVARLDALARRVRAGGGLVVFVRHTEPQGRYARGSPGWQLVPELAPAEGDLFVEKATCDAFAGTGLGELVPPEACGRLIVTGCATDFCVDTTVRSAAVRGYDVWAPADGHTTGDRPHLSAEQVIAHHNYVWSEFIGAHGSVDTTPIGGA
ncbi:MAG TPA: cysteine hydrolase family protein [Allosphingosinicella sp.]